MIATDVCIMLEPDSLRTIDMVRWHERRYVIGAVDDFWGQWRGGSLLFYDILQQHV